MSARFPGSNFEELTIAAGHTGSDNIRTSPKTLRSQVKQAFYVRTDVAAGDVAAGQFDGVVGAADQDGTGLSTTGLTAPPQSP